MEKEARKNQLNGIGHNHSRDSAIDADLQELETEEITFELVRKYLNLSCYVKTSHDYFNFDFKSIAIIIWGQSTANIFFPKFDRRYKKTPFRTSSPEHLQRCNT